MTNNSYTILSLFYNIFVFVIFFAKKKLNNIENRIYKYLILINFTNIVMALACFVTIMNRQSAPILNEFVSKSLLVCFLSWVLMFTYYVYVISFNKDKFNNYESFLSKGRIALFICLLIDIALIYFLPLYYFGENGVAYSYGPSANVVYITTALAIVSWLVMCFGNFKNIKDKKYLPVFLFVIFILIITYLQKRNPALLLITSVETFVTVVMYFSIENPDLKMLNEYNKAKEYAEDLNIEKQMFIYNVSQDMKMPLLKLANFCENLLYSEDLNEYKNGVRSIKSECNSILQSINGIYDLDVTDVRDLSTDNTKYNIINFLKLIEKNMSQSIKNSGKKIDFISSISNTLPNELLGDNTRLKQVLNIVFENALEYTNEGFINFQVQGLIKGDVCRLLITLEDSGIGIDSQMLDSLFDKDRIINIDDSKEEKIDDNGHNLALAKKIINILGGNLVISSEVEVGTKISIVLDQAIVKNEANDSISKYKNLDKKRVLVLGTSDDEQKLLMRSLIDIDIVLEKVDSLTEVISKIKKRNKYYAIILDGDLPYYSEQEMVEKLKSIKGLNSSLIILSKEKEMKSAKNRAILGYSGYIPRPFDEDDIKALFKKLENKK